jgi:CheY-like chemotaxis protein
MTVNRQFVPIRARVRALSRYLSGSGKYAERTQFPSPRVILLDLKMPRGNGFEFLEW